MKDYKRLTKRCGDIVNYAKPLQSNFIGAIYEEQKERDSEIMSRLAELEDKIESGELCEREEVRKETAREILRELSSRIWEGIDTVSDIAGREHNGTVRGLINFIKQKYGVDLEDEECPSRN